jgi:beta-glucosidase-like glycosyl hydrolase
LSSEKPATYRGVELLDGEERQAAARAGIDKACGNDDPKALLAIANDVYTPMEARKFAKARILAMFEASVANREARPDIDIDRVKASALSTRLDHLLPPGSPPLPQWDRDQGGRP